MTPQQKAWLFDPAALAEVESHGEAPLHVTRHGDPGAYFVRSETDAKNLARGRESDGPTHYLFVANEPEFPHGRCSCMDAECRITPKVVRGLKPLRRRCKHGRAVLSELAHAKDLCSMAGIPFSERIIPTLQEYQAGL